MRFSVFNTKIYISFLFLAIISLFLVIDKTSLFLPMLVAAGFHEFGHLILMWLFDCQPKEINLIPGSIQIVSSFSTSQRRNNLILAFGPLTNILIFAVLYINYCFFSTDGFITFAFINLLLGVFNLLPIKGLDGGSILHNNISLWLGVKKADLILNIITVCSAIIIITVAIIFSLNGKTSLSAYIVSVYLILSVLLKF